MRVELEEQLFSEYPELYAGAYLPMSQSLMCFGFECDDGWFDLIDKLSQELTNLGEGIVAVQVKEKYGELRFSITGGSDKALDLTDKAEEESRKVCEVCGAPGKTREVSGWLKTVCENHYTIWATRSLER